MSKDVCGVELESLADPIRQALGFYEIPDVIGFDLEGAVNLELTPDMPNSARSKTTVSYLGKAVGDLYLIVFKPGDGTGDESSCKLGNTDTGSLPYSTVILPRKKTRVHTEAGLTIAAVNIYNKNSDPVVGAGNLDLLEIWEGDTILGKNQVFKNGELGHQAQTFQQAVAHRTLINPVSTLTTGYRQGTDVITLEGHRHGDWHAAYNPHPQILQVYGFIAMDAATARDGSLNMFRELGSQPALPPSRY